MPQFSALPCGYEIWLLRCEDTRLLFASDYLCIQSIPRVSWEHRVSNGEAMLGADSRALKEITIIRRLRWLRYVLRMPTYRLPFVLFLHVLDKIGKNDTAVRSRLGVEIGIS